MKKNVLIIGSTGFIGRNVVQELLPNNYNLVLLVRDLKDYINEDYYQRCNLVEGDIQNLILIEKILVEHQIDLLIHLVSNLIPSSSLNEFNEELVAILYPTFNLLELLSRLKIMIVFFSSGGTIYGKATNCIDENNKLDPINYYGYSKLMIENHIRFLHTTQNLPYLILRPSNVYGRYQRIESKQGFIAVALGKFISNSAIEIWGNGEVVRDFIDVQDVSKGMRMLLEKNIVNSTLNLGSGEGNTLNEVVSILETILRKSIEVVYKNKRKVDLDRMVLDINRIKNYIDFKPKSLKEGINDFVEFIEINLNEK